MGHTSTLGTKVREVCPSYIIPPVLKKNVKTVILDMLHDATLKTMELNEVIDR
jgi:hypothetical protein